MKEILHLEPGSEIFCLLALCRTVPFRAEVSDPGNGKIFLIYITFLFTLLNEIRNVRIGQSYVGYALVLRSLMWMASFVTVISRR